MIAVDFPGLAVRDTKTAKSTEQRPLRASGLHLFVRAAFFFGLLAFAVGDSDRSRRNTMLPCPNDSDVSSVRSPVDTCNLVYSYSRSQAIADGMLVDLTEWASATTGFLGGFRIPVAVTAGVWSDLNSIPPRAQGYQDVRGRAHDLLYMASLAARHHPNENSLVFLVLIDIGRTRRQQYRLLVGPGDQGEPVATILRLNED